eukprot:Cvel_19422.t2-p1 / transcript=Cvel_19422.t2 / gene=Cvel_19422 / organism=Chromera_velia_CCMP2878 / gene_product=hypothetical protein / transcript_product=hypothetical protein / location=Cvel_scaffold1673:2208-3821(+) / protein_length=538 / sequence_SO=supercontig / SO=protein_coding / is_pseudo=false
MSLRSCLKGSRGARLQQRVKTGVLDRMWGEIVTVEEEREFEKYGVRNEWQHQGPANRYLKKGQQDLEIFVMDVQEGRKVLTDFTKKLSEQLYHVLVDYSDLLFRTDPRNVEINADPIRQRLNEYVNEIAGLTGALQFERNEKETLRQELEREKGRTEHLKEQAEFQQFEALMTASDAEDARHSAFHQQSELNRQIGILQAERDQLRAQVEDLKAYKEVHYPRACNSCDRLKKELKQMEERHEKLQDRISAPIKRAEAFLFSPDMPVDKETNSSDSDRHELDVVVTPTHDSHTDLTRMTNLPPGVLDTDKNPHSSAPQPSTTALSVSNESDSRPGPSSQAPREGEKENRDDNNANMKVTSSSSMSTPLGDNHNATDASETAHALAHAGPHSANLPEEHLPRPRLDHTSRTSPTVSQSPNGPAGILLHHPVRPTGESSDSPDPPPTDPNAPTEPPEEIHAPSPRTVQPWFPTKVVQKASLSAAVAERSQDSHTCLSVSAAQSDSDWGGIGGHFDKMVSWGRQLSADLSSWWLKRMSTSDS